MLFEGSELPRTFRNHLLPSCMAGPVHLWLSQQMFVQSVQQCSKRAKDLVLDFITIPKTSEKSGLFSVYVRKIKNAMDFHIRLLRTNYNSVFQQTSDCRLIFCYETETRVNEANCVYQCFKQKGSQLNFEASSLSGTNWGKLLQLYQHFLKLLSTILGKPALEHKLVEQKMKLIRQ